MNILGLCGKKESGKNTTANELFGSVMVNLELVEKHRINDKGKLIVPVVDKDTGEVSEGIIDPLNPNADVQQFFAETIWPYCKVYSLADPLKAICVQVLGLKPEQVYGTNDDKDTLTNFRWENMPGIIVAEKLDKEFGNMLCDWFPTEEEYKNGDVNKQLSRIELKYHEPGNMTAREVLQYVGTEIFRKMDNDVWINAVLRRIQLEQSQLAIICDVRFPNEVEGIQKAGGKVIKFLRAPHASKDQHISETMLDDKPDGYFDAVINNKHSNIKKHNEQVREVLVSWGWAELTEGK